MIKDGPHKKEELINKIPISLKISNELMQKMDEIYEHEEKRGYRPTASDIIRAGIRSLWLMSKNEEKLPFE